MFSHLNRIRFPKINAFLEWFNNIFFYNDFSVLAIEWFFIFTFFIFVLKITSHLVFLGMSEDVKKENEYIIVGKIRRRRSLFSYIQVDKPIYNLLIIRSVGAILNYIFKWIAVIFYSISFLVLISGITNFHFFFNNEKLNFYLFSNTNSYGVIFIVFSAILTYLVYLFVYHKYIKEYFSNLDLKYNELSIESIKKSSLRTGRQSDIKDLVFNENIKYNPLDYFSVAKKNNDLFLALNDEGKPLYFNKDKWNETNVQVIGKMGSGKGVLATSVLLQCYLSYNDLNIVFDPKNDEWAYHVFKKYTKHDEFFYIDINRGEPAQINIFGDTTSDELYELLVAGFGLGFKGTDADFFRTGDRLKCRELANRFPNGTTINELYNATLGDNSNDAKYFYSLLTELNELSCLQTSKGLSLKKIINSGKGGIIYITGSLRDENVVMLQKMLFLRCVQIIEKRDRRQELTHINIFLDEVKYLLSKSTLEAMGTIRDKKANIIYTHQSLGDLETGSSDLNGKTTRTVMLDNVGLRWIYKLDTLESAKWASELTSKTLKDVERRTITLNQANVEMTSREATIFQQQENYFDTNVIQHLPNRCGVIIGLEGVLPELAYSCPILVEKGEKKVMTKFVEENNVENKDKTSQVKMSKATISKDEFLKRKAKTIASLNKDKATDSANEAQRLANSLGMTDELISSNDTRNREIEHTYGDYNS